MATIRIGTFNCENLFLRYRFTGPYVKRKKGETNQAYESRAAKERQAALVTFEKEGSTLEWLARDLQDFSAITHTQRAATAAVIADNDPDIVALVEVESMEALRKFNSSAFFKKKRFPYFMLIDGNDPRGIDVALLSKHPVTHLRSYITDTYKTPKGATVETFSRDCLVARVEVDKKPITLFINHLKSQFQDNPGRRKQQAKRVAEIVEETFPQNTSSARFAVVGDFNQVPSDASLTPLLSRQWHEDILNRLPAQDRWTHVYAKNNVVKSVSQLDYILLS
ncbi:MAG: endonuclease/exonuclease/phosphatase family protein, partial [Bacteroidota bacterium]